VTLGRRIGILCTTSSTQGPSADLVREHAIRLERAVEIEPLLVSGAFQALSQGNRDEHDRLIREAAGELGRRNDVVVLAQASMAHLADELQAALPVPVLSSPPLCIEALVKRYGEA
jgi:Asp/Glu/hydantoin racemase